MGFHILVELTGARQLDMQADRCPPTLGALVCSGRRTAERAQKEGKQPPPPLEFAGLNVLEPLAATGEYPCRVQAPCSRLGSEQTSRMRR